MCVEILFPVHRCPSDRSPEAGSLRGSCTWQLSRAGRGETRGSEAGETGNLEFKYGSLASGQSVRHPCAWPPADGWGVKHLCPFLNQGLEGWASGGKGSEEEGEKVRVCV